MIFSSPVPPPMLGAGIASAKIHLSGEIHDLQTDLYKKIKLFTKRAKDLGLELACDEISPIQFVRIGDFDRTISVIKEVFSQGFFVNTCAYPAVPKNKCGLRVTITKHINETDISRLLNAIKEAMDLVPFN